MGIFSLNNGKSLDLSSLRAGLNVDNNNELLKSYDINNNSIFDSDELAKFLDDLQSADKDGDKKISMEEASNWGRLCGIAENKIISLFNDQTNVVDNTLSYLYEEQAKQNAINQFSKDFEEANNVFNAAKGGKVTQTYNDIKEFFNDEYASSKVYRQLCDKNVTSSILKYANENNGITKREYYKQKITFFSMMLNLSAAEKAKMFKSINDMPVEEFETLYQKLVNCEDNEYLSVVNEIKEKICPNFIDTKSHSDSGIGYEIKSAPGTIGEIIENKLMAESKLTFEQIYEKETGVNFDAHKINMYKTKELKAEFASELNNRIAPLQYDLAKKYEQTWFDRDNGLSETLTSEAGNNPQQNLIELKESTENALKQYYQNDGLKVAEFLYKTTGNEQFNELIENYNKQLAEIENKYAKDNDTKEAHLKSNDAKLLSDALQLMWSSNRDGVMNIAQGIYKEIQTIKETQIQKALDGNTVEEFSEELKQSYNDAFGNNSIDIAKVFAEDQQKGVMYAKIGAGASAAALTIATGGAITSLAVGAFSNIALNSAITLTEGYTKEGGMKEEDWAALKDELKMSGLFTISGVGVGMSAAKIGQILLAKCSGFMGTVSSLIVSKGAEHASSFAMSMLVDLALTHHIDISGETISELINIIIGAASGAKVINKSGLKGGNKGINERANEGVNEGVSSNETAGSKPKFGVEEDTGSGGYVKPELRNISIELKLLTDSAKQKSNLETNKKTSHKEKSQSQNSSNSVSKVEINQHEYLDNIRELDSTYKDYTDAELINILNQEYCPISKIVIAKAKAKAINSKSSIQIDDKNVHILPSQREFYPSSNVKITDSIAKQAIQCDVRFIEALGVKNYGIEYVKTHSKQEIFDRLSEDYMCGKDILEGINIEEKNNHLDAFFGRNTYDQPLAEKSVDVREASGDKVVHKLNNALAEYFDKNSTFKNEWTKYCQTDKTTQDVANYVQMVSNEYTKLGGNPDADCVNFDHIVVRSLQRNGYIYGNPRDVNIMSDSPTIEIDCETIAQRLIKIREQVINNKSNDFEVKLDDNYKLLCSKGQIHTIEYSIPKWDSASAYYYNWKD